MLPNSGALCKITDACSLKASKPRKARKDGGTLAGAGWGPALDPESERKGKTISGKAVEIRIKSVV